VVYIPENTVDIEQKTDVDRHHYSKYVDSPMQLINGTIRNNNIVFIPLNISLIKIYTQIKVTRLQLYEKWTNKKYCI